ncbi:MAG: STAS domain-containing protein [Candidatus Eisenbacteria bacterium]|nr:STAS domain-containing protein [Candidatus Eisenbacteria bacterium]
MGFDFEVNEVGAPGAMILRIQGNLDSKSTPVFLRHCHQVKAAGRNLVLNLSDVQFIASSGIGGLLALREDFEEAGLGVRYAALSSAVESVINLLNLGAFLGIYPTEDEALSSLAAQ